MGQYLFIQKFCNKRPEPAVAAGLTFACRAWAAWVVLVEFELIQLLGLFCFVQLGLSLSI